MGVPGKAKISFPIHGYKLFDLLYVAAVFQSKAGLYVDVLTLARPISLILATSSRLLLILPHRA